MKTSSWRASKRTPTWHTCMVAPKSLSGQPLDQVWNPDLARKGFWSYHTAISSGGSFQSSWCARFHGALRILWHFSTTPKKPFEHCGGLVLFFARPDQRKLKEMETKAKISLYGSGPIFNSMVRATGQISFRNYFCIKSPGYFWIIYNFNIWNLWIITRNIWHSVKSVKIQQKIH